jgi:hypothetical protein
MNFCAFPLIHDSELECHDMVSRSSVCHIVIV